MTWDRKLWGVILVEPPGVGKMSHRAGDGLLGTSWAYSAEIRCVPPSEPTRPLLFNTRRDAQAWCKEMNARQRERHDDWGRNRYRVVRVRERVTIEEG